MVGLSSTCMDILSLLNRGLSLMKRIVVSNAAKKAIIIKKLIHCAVRLLKSETLSKDTKSMAEGASICLAILSLLEWGELHKDALVPNEKEAISEIGSMMRRQRPSEIEVSTKPVSLYDCSVIVKALRSVLRICNDVLQRKDLPFNEGFLASLIELFQALGVGKMEELMGQSLTIKIEYLQMVDQVALTFKELTANDKYKMQQTGLFELLLPHLKSVYSLCVLFDERRDMSRHEACCTTTVSLIACFRNLTHSTTFQESLVEPKFIDFLFQTAYRYPQIKELLFNVLRILSKISTADLFCRHVGGSHRLLDQLIDLMQAFRENNFVIMRAAYILANLTAYQEDVAAYVYFKDKGSILACFEHFMSKSNDEDDYYESMIKSFAEFDFLNQDDKKVLNKVIRLMANMFTVEEPAVHFIKERFAQYKQLLKKLKYFMTEKELVNNSELLISVLNCISNILYFDKPNMTQNDFELSSLKQELTSAVAYITLQPKDEEILTEGLRVMSNLSRSKNGVKCLLKLKFHDAVLVLLKHRSRDVVFYSIGILINLTVDKEFKESKTCREVFISLIELLEECTIDDIEILGCAFKALVNIINDNLKNNDDVMTDMFMRLDKMLNLFGEECDIILTSSEISPEEAAEIQSLRAVINAVINVCPEEEYECTYKSCLRKFKSKDQLDNHIQKRHR